MVAFNGTINKPPKKPKANEQRVSTALLFVKARKHNETKIPKAPIGTIPSSICNLEALPATYEPKIKPNPLTAKIP